MARLELRRKIRQLEETEQQLQKANAILKRSEAQQLSQLEKQTLDLQRSNNDLQQFAHVASHDLGEPVRKIRYFPELIRSGDFSLLSQEGKMALDRIEVSTGRMQQMIEGVLHYSRQLAFNEDHEPVDLDELLTIIEHDLELIISENRAAIHRQPMGTVIGSSIQLYQLFSNLLLNALKFSHPGVTSNIQIAAHRTRICETDYQRITIPDNGIGFEPEHAERILQAYERLHSKDQYEGTGMELALCKKIAERYIMDLLRPLHSPDWVPHLPFYFRCPGCLISSVLYEAANASVKDNA